MNEDEKWWLAEIEVDNILEVQQKESESGGYYMPSFATKMSPHGDYNELEIIKLKAQKDQMMIQIMFIPQYLPPIFRSCFDI